MLTSALTRNNMLLAKILGRSLFEEATRLYCRPSCDWKKTTVIGRNFAGIDKKNIQAATRELPRRQARYANREFPRLVQEKHCFICKDEAEELSNRIQTRISTESNLQISPKLLHYLKLANFSLQE